MKNYASRENCDSRAWWILAPKHNLPTVKPDDSSLLLILCICCYRFRKILLFKFQDFWLNKQLLKTIFNHPSVRSSHHQLNLTVLFSSSPTPFIFIMRLWNYLIFCFVLFCMFFWPHLPSRSSSGLVPCATSLLSKFPAFKRVTRGSAIITCLPNAIQN